MQYGERWNKGRVLITGATGFLGIYILRELLQESKVSINEEQLTTASGQSTMRPLRLRCALEEKAPCFSVSLNPKSVGISVLFSYFSDPHFLSGQRTT